MNRRFPGHTAHLMLAVFIVLLVVPTVSLAQTEVPRFEPAECPFEGTDLGLTQLTGELLGFECGYVVVPERHANPDGRTIRLPVAIRRATSPTPSPDPLFIAQGGPGGDAFEIYTLLAPTTPAAVGRDIVIFNQRGTPYAEPDLACPETFEVLPDILPLEAAPAEAIYLQALAECRERLIADGVDLSAYNSLENAADINDIRRALGYDAYNLYGVSYGTLLALHLMRTQPEGLRSVILDSVAPPHLDFGALASSSEDRVYDELFAACLEDVDCLEAYPDLEARYFALIRQLDEQPVTLTVVHPDTGESHEALIDGAGMRGIMFQLLYQPRMAAIFPKLVADLEQGDYRYLEAMWPLLLFHESVSEGMYYSTYCAEDSDIDFGSLPLAELRPEIGERAEADLESLLTACALWDVEQLPAAVDEPVESAIPALLLSGRFDPITPPEFAHAAAETLPNSRALLDGNAAHGVAFLSPCVNTIVAEFLDDPSGSLDTSCLDDQQALAYVPPNAPVVPALASINALETGFLARMGVAAVLLLVTVSPLIIWPIVYVVRAVGEQEDRVDPERKRLRWTSRGLAIGFALVALVFSFTFAAFIIAALTDQTLLTAMSLPPAARPVLWLPLIMTLLVIGMLVAAVLLWMRPGAGSTAGKVYYSVVTAAALGIIVLLAVDNLLLPPL